MEALRRIQKNTVEKRLLNARGLPNFGINFYIVNKKGEYAGVSMYAGELRGVHRERAADAATASRCCRAGQANSDRPVRKIFQK